MLVTHLIAQPNEGAWPTDSHRLASMLADCLPAMQAITAQTIVDPNDPLEDARDPAEVSQPHVVIVVLTHAPTQGPSLAKLRLRFPDAFILGWSPRAVDRFEDTVGDWAHCLDAIACDNPNMAAKCRSVGIRHTFEAGLCVHAPNPSNPTLPFTNQSTEAKPNTIALLSHANPSAQHHAKWLRETGFDVLTAGDGWTARNGTDIQNDAHAWQACKLAIVPAQVDLHHNTSHETWWVFQLATKLPAARIGCAIARRLHVFGRTWRQRLFDGKPPLPACLPQTEQHMPALLAAASKVCLLAPADPELTSKLPANKALATYDTAEAMLAQAQLLLSNPSRRQPLVHAAKEAIENNHALQDVLHQLLTQCRQALNAPTPRTTTSPVRHSPPAQPLP